MPDVTPEMLTADRLYISVERLLAPLNHDIAAAGGQAAHPVATERLMTYWAHGEGAAKIGWGTDGDFDRCVAQLGKYVPPGEVKGLCANLHVKATGFRPGHAPGESRAH